MKTAAAYARFSTDMQREESIEAQLYDIREYAKKNNIIITDIYTDEGITGRSEVRDGFKDMMKAALERRYDYIIVHKVDRFARNKYISAMYKHNLKVKGVRVLYATQSISDTPEGRLMESMLEGISEYYSENLAEEVMKGLKVNARKAQFNGGTPPLGYDIDENKLYVINENEAIIVKKIFDLYLNGHGYTSICGILNSTGYKNKVGKPFVYNSIKPILTNKKYMGTYEYNKTSRQYTEKGRRNLKLYKPADQIIVVEDAIPPIIDKGVFRNVDEIIKSKQNVVQKHQKRKYLLKGLVECGGCGNKMSGHGQTNKVGARYYYYRCKKCNNTINAEHLEAYVIEIIKVHFSNNIDQLKEKVLRELEGTQSVRNAEMESIKKQMDVNQKEQDKVIDMAMKVDSNDRLVIRLKELDVEYHSLKERLSNLTPTAKFKDSDVIAWLDELKLNLENYSNIDKVINALVEKIIVNKDDIKVHLRLTKECITLNGVGLPAPYKIIEEWLNCHSFFIV